MPGAGKTSVGKEIAQKLNRPFIDIDEEIERLIGKKISDIFETQGEDAFRQIESQVIESIYKKTGVIIAIGGGAIKRKQNLQLLMQNSKIVLLRRNLSSLALNGRPLSLAMGVEKLAEERMPLYNKYCDVAIETLDGVQETAQAVLKILKLV
jgi:shikimate dehydrogenase